MSPDELGKADIALMNLLCPKSLSGAENVDMRRSWDSESYSVNPPVTRKCSTCSLYSTRLTGGLVECGQPA
jgi:hypothetical protein